MDDTPAPEPTDDINTYMDVLDCLVGKIKSGLKRIGMGNNFKETLRSLEDSKVSMRPQKHLTNPQYLLILFFFFSVLSSRRRINPRSNRRIYIILKSQPSRGKQRQERPTTIIIIT